LRQLLISKDFFIEILWEVAIGEWARARVVGGGGGGGGRGGGRGAGGGGGWLENENNCDRHFDDVFSVM